MTAVSHVRPSGRRPSRRPRVSVVMYWWEDRRFTGIARYAAEHDWELNCRMRWTCSGPEIPRKPLDGLIIDVGLKNTLESFASEMHGAGVSVVGTQQSGDYACDARVVVPHDSVGELGARHLLGLSLPHLFFVTFEDNPLERLRSAGFVATAREAGCPAREISSSEFCARLASLSRPMGVMAANDLNALEVMRACLDAGLRVPEDCAVVGADDTDVLCPFAPVPLTSVNCNFEEQGYVAAQTLAALMRGKRPGLPRRDVAPGGVTSRRSTDTLALPDSATSRALNFIRANFCRPIGVASVSENAGVPLRKLQTGFRCHVGRTMIEELTRLRVERAQLLLSSFQFKIDEIAAECGFASRFHFARAFHRFTGLTPTEYRAQQAEHEPAGV